MIPETTKLCAFCAELVPPKEESLQDSAHHSTIVLLEQSSQSCLMCRALLGDWSLEKIQRHFPDINQKAYDSMVVKVGVKEIQRIGHGLSWMMLNLGVHVRGFIYQYPFSITACDTKSVSASQPIWRASTTSIPDKINTLRSWLDNCELEHQNCKPLVRRMPKRLIDVGSPSGRPRLVLCEDLPSKDIRYATLSYCWGESTFCMTRENENLYKEEIPLQIVPRTLQDAIALTSDLEIQYLWIDALCIAQDNHAEWEIEASRMQDIYSGSSITIAAADAADNSQGCFSPNPRNLGNGEVFFTAINTTRDLSAIVRVQPYDIRTSAENSVLNTRGWVLQELVLSHRTVHCMRSGLYWECRSECRTETGLVFDRSMKNPSSIPILPHNVRTGESKTWWKWMESYSRRSFTFPSDRLPALSGMVQYYQRTTKDIPILGLWKSSFHQDLLWMRVTKLTEKVDSVPPHLSSIPSWTWLSCPHEIQYDFWNSYDNVDVSYHDHVRLLDWTVIWTSKPLLSDVKSSRIVLEGPVQEITLSVAPRGKDHNPTYLDVNHEKPDFEKQPFPWRCSGQFDSGPRMSSCQYLCLLLRSSEHKSKAYMKETFLILEPCLDNVTYRRVGIGNFAGEYRSFDLTLRRTLELA